MGMTYVQKLIARASGMGQVETGEVLELPVHLAMSHENAALVVNQFNEIFRDTGREANVWNPDRIAIIFDHRVPAESSKTATNQKKVRNFVGVSRRPRRRRRHLPPDPARERLCQAGTGTGGHRQPHDDTRRAWRVRVRHWRDRDGSRLGAGQHPQH